MKKSIILILFLAVVLLINGCTKDDISSTTKTTINEPFAFSGPIETDPLADKLLNDRVLKLKDKIEKSRTDKSSNESLDTLDAKQLLEALLNYDLTDLSRAFPEYRSETVTLLIPTDGGKITIEDVQEVYDHISDKVLEIIGSGGTAQIGSIQLISRPIGAGGQIPVDFILNVGFFPNNEIFTVANNDYWYWGKKLGKVNGQLAGQWDATSALTAGCNDLLIDFYQLDNYWFEGYTTVTISYNSTNVPPSQNTNYPFRMWQKYAEPITNPEPSLNPSDMNYYMNQILYLAQLNKPSGKAIERVIVSWKSSNYVQYPDGDVEARWHVAYIIYGTPHSK